MALLLILFILAFVLPLTGSLIYSLLINTVIGFILIFVVNAVFGLGIEYDLLVLVFVAIFGVFAVCILIILNLLGVNSRKVAYRSRG